MAKIQKKRKEFWGWAEKSVGPLYATTVDFVLASLTSYTFTLNFKNPFLVNSAAHYGYYKKKKFLKKSLRPGETLKLKCLVPNVNLANNARWQQPRLCSPWRSNYHGLIMYGNQICCKLQNRKLIQLQKYLRQFPRTPTYRLLFFYTVCFRLFHSRRTWPMYDTYIMYRDSCVEQGLSLIWTCKFSNITSICSLKNI